MFLFLKNPFLYLVYKHNFSLRKKDLSLPKVYLSNLGFAKRGETNKDLGKKMENAVFLELERRKSAQGSLSYWKNVQQEEVDFVVKNGADIECLIQVCADLNADTKKREWRALLKAARELKPKKLLCITENYASIEKVKGKKVHCIPLLEWLQEK